MIYHWSRNNLCWSLCYVLFGTLTGHPTTTTTTTTTTSSRPITSICRDDEFYCFTDEKCIRTSYKCDYYQDCDDGEDERNCGSCDFEEDMCGYTNNAHNRFERRKPSMGSWKIPSTDHTTNTTTGYFMMTNYVNNSNVSNITSIIQSTTLSTTSPQCTLLFNYYYTIHDGTTITIRHIQLYENKFIDSLLWKHGVVPRNKWQEVAIAIGQRPYGWSLVLNVDRTYVSIDDIRFEGCSYPRPNGSCNTHQTQCGDGTCIDVTQVCDFTNDCSDGSDEHIQTCNLLGYIERCDFEDGYCNWVQDPTDDFDWLLVSRSTLPYFPTVDHTTGTSEGTYLAVDVSKHEENTTAVLLSVLFVESMKNQCNMRLFYYICGDGHSLRVIQQTFNTSNLLIELVGTSTVTKGNVWKKATLNLNGDKDFHIVIEAKVGRDKQGVIAIDDVSFSPECDATLPPEPSFCTEDEFSCGDGQCVPCIQDYCVCNFVADCRNKYDELDCPSSCTFEGRDTCGWYNEQENEISWSIYKGYTPANATGPPYDHTKGTPEGYYLYVAGQQSVPSESPFPKAYFSSPMYRHGSYDCKFTFWYNMYHEQVIGHDDALLIIKYRSREGGVKRDTKIWGQYSTTYYKWKQAVVQLPRCPCKFNIIFEVDHYWKTQTDVAIDDWSFDCSERPPLPCNNITEFQCKISKQCVPVDSICDLDRNCCDGTDEGDRLCIGYQKLDFEHGFVNGWRQLKNDDFDFTLQQGPTDTHDTGPSADHTFQESHGTYIYTEATTKQQNETAAIASPAISPTTNKSKCVVRFWYSMYGEDMGTLKVYTAIDYGTPRNEVWSLSGNQGEGWKKASIQLFSEQHFQVIFEASIGVSYKSDIAMDDISFTPGCIFNGSILPGAPTSPPPNPCAPNFHCGLNDTCINQSDVCNFELDCVNGSDEREELCGYPQGFEHGVGPWQNLDTNKLDFVLHNGPTPTSKTGPSTDATGNKTGYYIYLESSNRAPFSEAVIESPWYKDAYADCKLNVSFHMYGMNIGEFKIVLIINNTEPTDLLDLRGDMGNRWIHTNISIGRRREPFKIQFHASVGDGDKGDIAIDEINFVNCSHPPPCLHNDGGHFKCRNNLCIPRSKLCDFVNDCGDGSDENTLTVCYGYQGCNFDDIPCNFTQDHVTDDFDWLLNHGQTMSFNTGPTHDHTLRTSKGNYSYIEASNRRPGEKARLQTFTLYKYSTSQCIMKFYYHMFGESLGELNINVLVGHNRTRTLWRTFTGPSMFMWREAVVDLSNVTDVFQVEFEGVTGNNYQGDIAIDDIIFSPRCSTRNQPTLSTPGKCLPDDTKCNNVTTTDCKLNHADKSCGHLYPKKSGTHDAFIIAILSGLLVVSVVTVIIVILVARKRQSKKFHIYSIFNDSVGNQEMEPRIIPETNVSPTDGAVSNRAYDNVAIENDIDDVDDVAEFAEQQNTNTPPAIPLYQEIFHIT